MSQLGKGVWFLAILVALAFAVLAYRVYHHLPIDVYGSAPYGTEVPYGATEPNT
jgi:hypothetical protein